jgi:hypothetical protein
MLMGEATRLLRPSGRLLVFNWSYRGDAAADEAEAAAYADQLGLRVARAGETPFAIWDARGWLFERSA